MLEEILKNKKKEIDTSRDYLKRLEEMASERVVLYPLERVLSSCRTRIIAEVKRFSPSEGHIKEVSASQQARLYQKAGAVAVSVLTDKKFFGGSLLDLLEVRREVDLPLLRKDFILHPLQVLEAKAYGGDVVLLIVRVLEEVLLRDLLHYAEELGLSHIVEVFNLEEAERALKVGARVIGINNRDLDTLRVDVSLSEKLAPQIKAMGAKFVIAESGIESREQVLKLENLGVDAFLVGTSLMKSPDPLKKLRELMGYNL
ncbi:MAG: indole-3-glycerol phosphate synthase TrpC [Aquificaceae bacterium]|nr:indole-3-glycerol phosphate synthase TrpC [Aquificaceae bacterium]MCX7989739.1 indole-3-glycerol phosphate synthase TrpC [Aquificaceae bacterium]MDW8294630.1 indole-3-glycerol phosphate synthase TrpC [Aquificaceae bacterium]